MSILSKLKELLFGSDKSEIESAENDIGNINHLIEVIHVNPNVYLAHRGARICIGKGPIDGSISDMMENVSRVIGRGHESVSEHTNSIVIWNIPKELIQCETNYTPTIKANDYSDTMANMKYLNVVSKPYIVEDTQYGTLLLIGGSVRAWLHLLRETKKDNVFKKFIQLSIYNTFEKCFLLPSIEAGLLEEDKCTYLCDSESKLIPSKVTQVKNKFEKTDEENYDFGGDAYIPVEVEGEHVDLVYKPPINSIYKSISFYGFTLRDLYNIATFTVIFHDISRTCSHQLVRHRNGISQESQRYVTHDYDKKKDFIDPISSQVNDRYAGKEYEDVLDRIEEVNPFKMYKYLMSNKVLKEDARAWLPSNVTTRLIMTFTYSNFAKFLQLRLDKAAQKEIREVAEESVELVLDPSTLERFIELCCTPIKLSSMDESDLVNTISQDDVDEIIEEKEIPPDSIKIDDAQKMLDMQSKMSNMEVRK